MGSGTKATERENGLWYNSEIKSGDNANMMGIGWSWQDSDEYIASGEDDFKKLLCVYHIFFF